MSDAVKQKRELRKRIARLERAREVLSQESSRYMLGHPRFDDAIVAIDEKVRRLSEEIANVK